MSIRVALADDHEIVLEGLSTMLAAKEVDVVAATQHRDELLEILRRERPDVAVVDLAMPGVSIPQLLAMLDAEQIPTALLVLTGTDEPEVAREILAAGARGYLLKDHAFDTLFAAIQAVLSGATYVDPQVAGQLLTGTGTVPQAAILTPRQLEILRLVAAGHTSKNIAGRLGIHIKTVDNHRHAIRQILGVHSTAEMVRVAKEKQLI